MTDLAEDEEHPKRSGLGRAARALGTLLRVLVLPDRAMPEVVSESRYGLALLLTTVAACVFAGAVSLRVDPSHELASMGEEAPQSDREIAEAVAKQITMIQVKLGLSAALGTPSQLFLLALGLYLLGRYVGGRPTVRRMMSAVAYGSLPMAMRSLLGALSAWQASHIAPSQIPRLLGAGLPLDGALGKLFAEVDGFSLYSLVLIGFGFRSAAQCSRTKAIVTVGVSFLLYLAVTRLIAGGGGQMPQGAR